VIELNFTLGILVANFLILMFILNKRLFKPMLGHLEQRDEAIYGSLKRAKDMEEKSEKKLQEYKRKLQEEKSNILREQNLFREQALENQKEILKNMRLSSEAKLSEVKAEVDKQIEDARKELSKLTATLASEIVNVIIGSRKKY